MDSTFNLQKLMFNVVISVSGVYLPLPLFSSSKCLSSCFFIQTKPLRKSIVFDVSVIVQKIGIDLLSIYGSTYIINNTAVLVPHQYFIVQDSVFMRTDHQRLLIIGTQITKQIILLGPKTATYTSLQCLVTLALETHIRLIVKWSYDIWSFYCARTKLTQKSDCVLKLHIVTIIERRSVILNWTLFDENGLLSVLCFGEDCSWSIFNLRSFMLLTIFYDLRTSRMPKAGIHLCCPVLSDSHWIEPSVHLNLYRSLYLYEQAAQMGTANPNVGASWC